MILRTPATATSDGPGADAWRRTDGGFQKRGEQPHVALLLESRRPPYISLDSEAVLPGMVQLSPPTLLPAALMAPFHLPDAARPALWPSTSTHTSISGSVCSGPLAPHGQELARKAPVARKRC